MPLNFGSPEFFNEMVLRRSTTGHRSQVHVLLHPTNGQDAVDKGAVACLEPFSIGDILWLCRLPDELRDAVFKACEGIGTSQQFIDRVRLLAGDLGLSFSENDAKGLWDHRSDVVHGRDPWLSVRDPNDPQWQMPPIRKSDLVVRRYLAAEEILRKTILKCLTDSAFASHFASDSTVKAKYPLVPKPRP